MANNKHHARDYGWREESARLDCGSLENGDDDSQVREQNGLLLQQEVTSLIRKSA
jgi:hypothetical protein